MNDAELIKAGWEVSKQLGGIGTRDGRIVRALIVRFEETKLDRSDRMAGFVAEAEGLAHRLRLHAGLSCPAPAVEPGRETYQHIAKVGRIMREAGPPGPIDENEVHENSRGLDCE